LKRTKRELISLRKELRNLRKDLFIHKRAEGIDAAALRSVMLFSM
jgi:hypothetical protein